LKPKRGTLYLVGTPIGNLDDISSRAIETLRQVRLVACEDTRRTRILLDRFGIETPTTALPAFDEERRAPRILERLRAGDDVALVTDAGMPGISDPGEALVRLAVEEGVQVVPIPGPSAALAALAASGLPTSRFAFFGFLPRKGKARRETIAQIAAFPGTCILYESPRRLAETLRDLQETLGDRRACVARELTKMHEEIVRGRFSELASRFSGEVLGEVTIVVEGGSAVQSGSKPEGEADLDTLLRSRLAAGISVKDAAREVAEALGLPRKDVYRRALDLAGDACRTCGE